MISTREAAAILGCDRQRVEQEFGRRIHPARLEACGPGRSRKWFHLADVHRLAVERAAAAEAKLALARAAVTRAEAAVEEVQS